MKFFKERRLRTDIFITFSVLILVSITCETLYSSNTYKNIVLQFEKDFYSKKFSSVAANWIDSYFNQVSLIVSILSKNGLNQNDENTSNFADFAELFKVALKKTPFCLTFQVALNDGCMLQVRNIHELSSFQTDPTTPLPPYASYIIRKMEYIPGNTELTESWEYMNEDFTPIIKETLPFAQYDVRERSWYINTSVNKKLLWSEAYILKTTKVAGITVSSPILSAENKNVSGIVSVDFSLNDFKELLKSLTITEHSTIRLINDKNEILASSIQNEQITSKNDDLSVLPKVIDIDDEILQIAAKNLLGTNDNHVIYQDSNGNEYAASKQKLNSVPFSVLTTAPQSDLTNDFDKLQINTFLLSIFVFLLSSGVIFLLSRRITYPITQIFNYAIAIQKMELDEHLELPKSNIFEIKKLSAAMETMKTSIAVFSKYAPKKLVEKVLKSEEVAGIGGMTKEVTLLFSDIEKFSTISEKLPAEYLILHLSEYFDELTQNIMEHNGTIDKYIGDAIMAVWGAQAIDECQCINACAAALDCCQLLKKLKEKWVSLGKPPLPTRFGLHSGMAVVGNVGSQDRMNFTAIGNSVDIASSLEEANKVYGTQILASETIERKARDKVLFRVIDKVAVNGAKNGIVIFEPVCSLKNANDMYYKMLELCSKSKEAFELYQTQKFGEALKLYKEISEMFPEKAHSIAPLITRCEEFAAIPPKDWDGVHRLWR